MATNESTGPGAVVVTGASTGIGEACAMHLDGLGFRVFAGVRRQADAEALQRRASDRLTPVFIEVTDAESIGAAAAAVAETVGQTGLAGLVNNAGIVVAGPLEFVPLAEFRRQLEVNVTGQIAVTQALLGLLRQGRGRVVNVGSLGGRLAKPFMGPYCASKFAMEALTDSLRMELRPWGIHVSIVEPGQVATPIWEKTFAAVEAMAQDFPQRAHDLYGSVFATAREQATAARRMAVPAAAVARVVARALTEKRPKPRYLVGRGARLQAVCSRLLPDRVLDRLILRALKIPRRL